MRTVGWLSADPQVSPEYIAFFTEVMRGRGWAEGTNIVYVSRFGDSGPERLAAMVTELVRMNCDAIVAIGTPAPLALKQATNMIPIVLITAGIQWPTGSFPTSRTRHELDISRACREAVANTALDY